MATSEAPLSTSEGHVDERFVEVCRRLDGIRTWLIVLSCLYAVQLAGLISLAIVMSRLGR